VYGGSLLGSQRYQLSVFDRFARDHFGNNRLGYLLRS